MFVYMFQNKLLNSVMKLKIFNIDIVALSTLSCF